MTYVRAWFACPVTVTFLLLATAVAEAQTTSAGGAQNSSAPNVSAGAGGTQNSSAPNAGSSAGGTQSSSQSNTAVGGHNGQDTSASTSAMGGSSATTATSTTSTSSNDSQGGIVIAPVTNVESSCDCRLIGRGQHSWQTVGGLMVGALWLLRRCRAAKAI